MNVKIEPGWGKILQEEFDKPYFENIVNFLKTEKAQGKTIYPAGPDIFRAFELAPFEDVKAVLLGQDPYHGPGQAHGLCFSVQKGVALPPSLQNIYKELKSDTGIEPPHHGNLEAWARQGLLMLNASLTVEAGKANSHANIGWHTFTDSVIKKISDNKTGIVFILWGRFAQQKKALIDLGKHFVLEAAHPSPFSVHSGFFGSRPFTKTNQLLEQVHKAPIDWQIQD